MSENETTVVETTPGESVEPTTTTTPENVPSTEVKPVQTPETEPVQKDDVSAKMQTQIDNLNTALKQERDSNKTFREESGNKSTESQETIERLKTALNGPEQQEETQPDNVSMNQIEELLDRRDAKRQEEAQKETQAQSIKKEVTSLEEKWNGENGKPKYDDKKVLQWQENNSKLHLSPGEAFNEMSRDTIIDYEIKARLAKKPNVQNVEIPGGTPGSREPDEKKPETTEDLRSAVFEAMDTVADENIN